LLLAVLAGTGCNDVPSLDRRGTDAAADARAHADASPPADRAAPDRPDALPALFSLRLTIKASSAVTCTDYPAWETNCLGPTFWYLYDSPPDPKLARPQSAYQNRYYLDAHPGSVIEGAGFPVRPRMYLAIFIDDDDNALHSGVHVPDEGDLVYVDDKPFSAVPGQFISRTITFTRRHKP
jgi:hypothetical protein